MTRLEFELLCGSFLIEPSLALENDLIREALAERDDKAVRYLLETEF